MIILLATDGKYTRGNDFPMFSMPLKMDGATSQSLEDFQWWAYSSDFKKWLDKNPKEWVADSEEMPKYNDLSEIIRESLGGSGYSIQKALKEASMTHPEGRVSKFGDFISDAVFEEDSSNKAEEEKVVKFHFAYNKLDAEGKLDNEFIVRDQIPGKPKAVFLCLEDQETGANLIETLDAYRMMPLEIENKDSKFRLFEISDSILGGKVADDQTGPGLGEKAVKIGIMATTYAVAALGIFAGVKYLGGAFLLNKGLKSLDLLKAGKKAADLLKSGKEAATAAKSAGIFAKTGKGIKGLWGMANPAKAVSFFSKMGKAGIEGAKLQRALGNMEKAGTVAKAAGMVKGFVTGAKAAGGVTKAAELTNPIGWALLAIDAVGSTWNWYSGNQAPRYGTVESFAKGSFDPKSIEIGVPITVCWSQPAGGWGMAVSFLYNNETRTTMELVKIADTGGESIFILNQINSKEVQKQIAQYDLTLISFDNGDVVERGWIDNEDLDFKMLCVKKDLNALFNYQGSCDWELFETEFNNASGTLLVSDPNAPEEYEFNFSDSENNVINVVGKKVTTEELSKYSSDDLSRIFGITASEGSEKSRIKTLDQAPTEDSDKGEANDSTTDQTSTEDKAKSEVNDSLSTSSFSDLRVITKFSDFKKHGYSILDEDENDQIKTDAGDSSEGTDDVDSKGSEIPALTAKQKSGPAEIAVYIVTERDYANPKLRGKYETGEFTNFLLDPKDWEARNGDPIDVEPNTDEILEDSKRGLYTYVEKKEEETKPVVKDEVQGADDEEKEEEPEIKKDDYYITVDPKDVKIKDKKSSTVVRDTSMTGGINLFDTILTPRDKETLKIENWKTITFAKELRDNRGDIREVKFRNKYAPFGDKSRKYRSTDGEAFELAKNFIEQTKDRIKYE
jgi:hypothetical protein